MSNITSFVIVLSHVIFFFKTVILTEENAAIQPRPQRIFSL